MVEKKLEIKHERHEPKVETREERVVRILATDIEGNMKIYPGLTKIKGVSWSVSNAVCNILKLDKKRTIGQLTNEEIKKVSDFIRNPKLPFFIFNRRKDFETGENKHLTGSDLDLRRDFDIKRLRKIKSYRGLRHALNQPVRGQRTKAHFRSNRRKGVGIKNKKKDEKK